MGRTKRKNKKKKRALCDRAIRRPTIALLLISLSINPRHQAPQPKTGTSGSSRSSGGGGTRWTMGAGFHHKSHKGRRVNCLLWSCCGGELFSVCDGGIVVLAKNLRPPRGVPAAGPVGMMGVVSDGK